MCGGDNTPRGGTPGGLSLQGSSKTSPLNFGSLRRALHFHTPVTDLISLLRRGAIKKKTFNQLCPGAFLSSQGSVLTPWMLSPSGRCWGRARCFGQPKRPRVPASAFLLAPRKAGRNTQGEALPLQNPCQGAGIWWGGHRVLLLIPHTPQPAPKFGHSARSTVSTPRGMELPMRPPSPSLTAAAQAKAGKGFSPHLFCADLELPSCHRPLSCPTATHPGPDRPGEPFPFPRAGEQRGAVRPGVPWPLSARKRAACWEL